MTYPEKFIKSSHFLDVVDVFDGAKRIDYLTVSLVFLELCALNGKRNTVNAKTGVNVSGVNLDIVDSETKLSDCSNEALKIFLVLKLKMHFEVIGAILEMSLHFGEERKANHHSQESDKRNGIESCADKQTDKSDCPKSCRSGKSLNLAL